MKHKTFIVACNAGVATSQTIASKIQGLLNEKGIDNVSVEAVDIKSLDMYLRNASAYIAVITPDKDYDLPVINGLSFLTGTNQEEELNKLIKIAIEK
ncbi:PTS sugar transporter subunit IIB [Amphibacillus sp. Q70]|uniref:PTS sugar transporter subunit IIB n=1 Tax=Amphibacillus sp. Q70 TaxID=3453416 RepID=UPI003F86EAC9